MYVLIFVLLFPQSLPYHFDTAHEKPSAACVLPEQPDHLADDVKELQDQAGGIRRWVSPSLTPCDSLHVVSRRGLLSLIQQVSAAIQIKTNRFTFLNGLRMIMYMSYS